MLNPLVLVQLGLLSRCEHIGFAARKQQLQALLHLGRGAERRDLLWRRVAGEEIEDRAVYHKSVKSHLSRSSAITGISRVVFAWCSAKKGYCSTIRAHTWRRSGS